MQDSEFVQFIDGYIKSDLICFDCFGRVLIDGRNLKELSSGKAWFCNCEGQHPLMKIGVYGEEIFKMAKYPSYIDEKDIKEVE